MNEKQFKDIFSNFQGSCTGSFKIVDGKLEKIVDNNIEWGDDDEEDKDETLDN